MDENIAEVYLDFEAKTIARTAFQHLDLRFKCKRCAVFCCALGGPMLSNCDVERLKKLGHKTEDFLDQTPNKGLNSLPKVVGSLKSKNDGSCIFLKSSQRKGLTKCTVYDSRPILCRLYPFELERTNPQSFKLKIIPCCNGLNAENGELVNEPFISKHLLGTLLDFFNMSCQDSNATLANIS